jgi:hypothetical protein
MKIKWYYIIWTIIIIPAYLGILMLYGWSCFATMTARAGLNADMYMYYNLTRTEYSLYKLAITITAFVLFILHLNYLYKNNNLLLAKLIWAFLIFICLIILCESLLATGFVGKG